MGAEASCVATYRGQTSRGKALLETDYLLFRGDFRLRIAFAGVRSVEATDSTLSIQFGDEGALLELGRYAEPWAKKIRSPKSLLDKLGVKAEQSITVLSVGDGTFLRDLRDGARDVATDRRKKRRDIVFLGVESSSDLAMLESMEQLLRRDGTLWVVYPKGQKNIAEGDVLAAGKAAGLVDVKVVRFSDTHTALKFVVPVGRR